MYVHAIAVEAVLARDSLPVVEVSLLFFVAATPSRYIFRVEVYGREARVRTRRQHQFGYPNERVSLSCRGQLAIVAAWGVVVVVVVVVDGGVTNTYALTGLEVNLYAKEQDCVSHLNASFW